MPEDLIPPSLFGFEIEYIRASLPQAVRCAEIGVDGSTLVLRFPGKALAARARTHHDKLIFRWERNRQYKCTLPNFDHVRYEWNEGGMIRAVYHELRWSDGNMNPIDLSGLPRLEHSEILQLLETHQSETGLPGSCMTMDTHRAIAASSRVDISCGIPPTTLITSGIDGSLYYPGDELDRYLAAIRSGAGRPVEVEYVSAKVTTAEHGFTPGMLYQRKVRGFLALTDMASGNPTIVRVVTMLKAPVSLDRVLELAR